MEPEVVLMFPVAGIGSLGCFMDLDMCYRG